MGILLGGYVICTVAVLLYRFIHRKISYQAVLFNMILMSIIALNL